MSDRSPRERSDASALQQAAAAAKREGREIAGEARSAAERAAREQRDVVAGFVSALVGAASRGAEELEESGFSRSAAAVRRTAGEVGGLAGRLQERDPAELWGDIEDFAREHPVMVFGAGFALAFGLARFLKSGRSDEAGGYPTAGAYGRQPASGTAASGTGGRDPLAGTPGPQVDPVAGASPAGAG